MRGPSMFDSRTKARSLAFLFAAGALVSMLTLVLPAGQSKMPAVVFATAACSAVLALAFLRWASRIGDQLLHAALALVTVILSLVIHYTQENGLYPLI
jgi:hypothetical protein